MTTSIDRLIRDGSKFLATELRLKEGTIKCYVFAWLRIKRFMEENGIKAFDRAIEARYVKKLFKDRKDFKKYTKWERALFYRFKALTQFQEKGKINPTHRLEILKSPFQGAIGNSIAKFLKSLREHRQLAEATFTFYDRQLHLFYCYCEQSKIKTLKSITPIFIVEYLKQHSAPNKNSRRILIIWMEFLYEQKLIPLNIARVIPKGKNLGTSKLPSSYSESELKQLLSSIDQTTATGKRHFAMLLLACELGLRASDVINLKYENILWESSEIKINQHKTGRPLVNPLLPHIGNAIYNYLLVRPDSKSSYIFLTAKPPYNKFVSGSTFSGNVQRIFSFSGVSTNGRKTGAHSLRHSFADRLNKKRVSIELTSQLLGHAGIESTGPYTRTDLTQMKACLISVPKVGPNFYVKTVKIFHA